jgi:hypothetical protein
LETYGSERAITLQDLGNDVLAGVRGAGVGEKRADLGVRAVGADQQVICRSAAVDLLHGIEARLST